MSEQWLPVVGWEAYYDVSDHGRVRTKHLLGRACKKKILSLIPNKKGYLRVRLTCPGVSTTSVVHRLVLAAFVGPQPSPEHECNHKNGVKSDNRLENLEWVTRKENNRHAVENGFWHPHIGEDHGMARLTAEQVRNIRLFEGTFGASELGRTYNVSGSAIRLIWKRKNWKHVE